MVTQSEIYVVSQAVLSARGFQLTHAEGPAFLFNYSNMDKISIWLRLGGTISATVEDAKKILDGDAAVLQKAIAKDGFTINGESYIPGDNIEDICKEHALDDSEFGGGKQFDDVDFSFNDIMLKCEPQEKGKELLKVTNLKEAVCETKLNVSTTHEKEMVGAALLSMMDQDDEFAKLVLKYTGLYLFHRKSVKELNKEAMHRGEIKTKN